MANRAVGDVHNTFDWIVQHGRRGRQKFRRFSPGAKVVFYVAVALLAAPVLYHLLEYVVPLPVWPGTEKYCDKHKLGCDFTTHLLADVIVAVIALAWFLSRQSRNSTWWRRRAKSEPHRLFPWVTPVEGGLTDIAAQTVTERRLRLPTRLRSPAARLRLPSTIRLPWPRRSSPLVESILGRDVLVGGIADDLESGCDAQVVVGNSAAGKTMVLIKLADCLARRRRVPIPISVQGRRGLDFEKLAWETYEDASPGVKEEEVKKQWAELRHRRQVVVLADDLEKADAQPHEVESALRRASQQKLPLVAASRPYGLPADFTHGRIDLEPLQDPDVCEDLVKLIERASDVADTSQGADTVTMVEDLVSRAEIRLTLYYLSLARVLAKHGMLTSPPEDEDARLWLMRTYRRALELGLVRPDAGLRRDQREGALKHLEPIAFARVLGDQREDAIAAKLADLGVDGVDVNRVVESARRLGVLDARHDGRVRFAHPTTMAFFASCFLCDPNQPKDSWKMLVKTQWGPFRVLTLVFATVESDDPDHTTQVCDSLLARAETDAEGPDGTVRAGSTWLAAAAEIARHGRSLNQPTAAKIVGGIERELDESVQLGFEQLTMLRALGALCGKSQLAEAYEALWSYGVEGSNYWFCRRATKELMRAPAPLDALLPIIDAVMDNGRRYEQRLTEPALEDRNQEPFVTLRAVAWILPSLRSVLFDGSGDPQEVKALTTKLERYQEDLIRYARTLTVQRGLEAAVAQGFKFDAVRAPWLEPDRYAIEMLSDKSPPDFWFSRLLLVQALAIRCDSHTSAAALSLSDTARSLIRAALKDPNTFVQHTAKLCLRALDSKEANRFLVEDLTDAVNSAPYHLDRETSQLVGDVVLALNLNEYGDAESRRAFGQDHRTPACLTGSRRRDEILLTNAERPACPFAEYQESGCLCPYSHEPADGATRREITRAFCRHQRLNARPVPWNSGMRAKHVREFWERMEDLARY